MACATPRTSRPTSPNTAVPCAIGRLRRLEATAATIPKSTALDAHPARDVDEHVVGHQVKPRALLEHGQQAPHGLIDADGHAARLRGGSLVLTSACTWTTSLRGGAAPPSPASRWDTRPGTAPRRIWRRPPTMRSPVISNTPSSLAAPKRFLIARTMRCEWCRSPSKYSTVSTTCSRALGPARLGDVSDQERRDVVTLRGEQKLRRGFADLADSGRRLKFHGEAIVRKMNEHASTPVAAPGRPPRGCARCRSLRTGERRMADAMAAPSLNLVFDSSPNAYSTGPTVCAKFAAACRAALLLELADAGLAAEQDQGAGHDAAAEHPESNSPMPVLMQSAFELRVALRARHREPRNRVAMRGRARRRIRRAFLDNEFHALQSGQRPCHFGCCAPHPDKRIPATPASYLRSTRDPRRQRNIVQGISIQAAISLASIVCAARDLASEGQHHSSPVRTASTLQSAVGVSICSSAPTSCWRAHLPRIRTKPWLSSRRSGHQRIRRE